MKLQTTVDLSLIRGLVTRIDRCSSGGLPMSRERASIDIGHLLLLSGFPHRDLTAAMHAVLLLMCRTLLFR